MTEATSNAKQVFYLMIEFDQDYGCFPNDDTAIDELAAYHGGTANDYLAQLIAGEYTTSEEIFYAKGGVKRGKKPDNVISGREHILAKGECGFAYLKGYSTSARTSTPILLTPMTGDGTKFDSDPHDGKAVVLRIDGAVKQLRIDRETGQAIIAENVTLFQSGKETAWEEREFVLTDLVFPK